MYFLLSFKAAGEANWTAPAAITLGILATALWLEQGDKRKWLRSVAATGIGLSILLSLAVINTDALRALGLSYPTALDPSTRLRGWKSTAEHVAEMRAQFEQYIEEPVFLIANKYQTAAALAFYMPDKPIEQPGHPPVYIPESQDIQNQFSLWRRYDEFIEAPPDSVPQDEQFTEQDGINPFLGRIALYLTDRPDSNPPRAILNGFERCEMVGSFYVKRRGNLLRSIRLFACYNYRTVPL